MRILIIVLIFSYPCFGQKIPALYSYGSIDSLLIEFDFNTANAIAAKMFIRIDINNVQTAGLTTYTHKYRSGKLITKDFQIETSSSLVEDILELDLKSAEEIDGYELLWLDGTEWRITIHSKDGTLTYSYPELYNQNNLPELKHVISLFNRLEDLYSIDSRYLKMKLAPGKYHNYSEAILTVR